MKKKEQRKERQEKHSLRGARPPPIIFSPEAWPSSSLGPITLAAVLQPTLVLSKNSTAAPMALTSHNSLTAGTLGRPRSQSLPTLFHSLFICGAHALHSTDRW